MNHPIGYTHSEIINMMMSRGIFCSTQAFKEIIVEAQARALVFAIGPQRAREVMQGEAIDQAEVMHVR